MYFRVSKKEESDYVLEMFENEHSSTVIDSVDLKEVEDVIPSKQNPYAFTLVKKGGVELYFKIG